MQSDKRFQDSKKIRRYQELLVGQLGSVDAGKYEFLRLKTSPYGIALVFCGMAAPVSSSQGLMILVAMP